jgi:hypothetical protein
MRAATSPPGRRRAARVTGAAVIVAACGVAVAAYLVKPHPQWQPWPVLGMWLAGIALFLAGARVLDHGRPSASRTRLARDEVAVIALLTVAGLLARVVALGSVPDNVAGDEAESAVNARSFLLGESRDPFSTGWAGHPTLWFLVQGLSMRAFGDDPFGARMIAALLGAATVPALYVYARQPFGRTVATLAAALLATLAFHVHYSRIAVNSVGDPLLMLVALGLLLAGLRSASRLTLAAAGVAAGVAQHFYLGSRLVPLVLVAVLLHQLVVARPVLARAAVGLALAAVGFLVAYGPGVRVPLYHRNDYNARLSQVGIFQTGWYEQQRELGRSVWDIFWAQTVDSVGAFTHVVDLSPNYLAGMPIFDSLTAAFFVLGAIVTAFAWRRAETAALFAWLSGTVVAGGILMVSPPQSHRYVTAVAPACLLAAVGLVRTAPVIASAFPARLSVRAPAVTAVLVLGIALWNLDFYFREYSARYTYGSRKGEEITEIGRYLARQPAGAHAFFLGAPWTFYEVGTIRFLAPDVPGSDVGRPITRVQDVPRVPAGSQRRPVFLFLPPRVPELRVVRRVYPRGRVLWFVGKADRQPLFVAYEPARSTEPLR